MKSVIIQDGILTELPFNVKGVSFDLPEGADCWVDPEMTEEKVKESCIAAQDARVKRFSLNQ